MQQLLLVLLPPRPSLSHHALPAADSVLISAAVCPSKRARACVCSFAPVLSCPSQPADGAAGEGAAADSAPGADAEGATPMHHEWQIPLVERLSAIVRCETKQTARLFGGAIFFLLLCGN